MSRTTESSPQVAMKKKKPQENPVDKENIPPLVIRAASNKPRKTKFFESILNSPLISPKLKKKISKKNVFNKLNANAIEGRIEANQRARSPSKMSLDSAIDISGMWRDDTTIVRNQDSNGRHQSTISIGDVSAIRMETRPERCSEAEFDADRFSSTFVYPLHSTFNYSVLGQELGPLCHDVELEFGTPLGEKFEGPFLRQVCKKSISSRLQLSPLKCLEDQFHDELIAIPRPRTIMVDNGKISHSSIFVSSNLKEIKRRETTLAPTKILAFSSSTKTSIMSGTIEDKKFEGNRITASETHVNISKAISRRSRQVKENEYVASPKLTRTLKSRSNRHSILLRKEFGGRSEVRSEPNFNARVHKSCDPSLTVVSDASFDETVQSESSAALRPNFLQACKLPKVTNRSTQTEITPESDLQTFGAGSHFAQLGFNVHPFQMQAFSTDIGPGLALASRVPCHSNVNRKLRSIRRLRKNILELKSYVTDKSHLSSNSKFSVLANL